jgi:hypothetical protein
LSLARSGYPIVDTNQEDCYDTLQVIAPPTPGEPFYGQDAQHQGNQPSYHDNGDGTISDLVTGLMWVQARGEKVSWYDALDGASACRVGGYDDWRMPTIKELYSLIDFSGFSGASAYDARPYLDTTYFEFRYGDTLSGERYIDCQDWSANLYVGTVMVGDSGVFGVNFADGRIKGYPVTHPQPPPSPNHLHVRYVRGNPSYGANDFQDNGDGTVTDVPTGLMWSKQDSDSGMNWQEALAWTQARNDESWLGHNDWRLPNAKELQSLVDYAHSPGARNPEDLGPALDTTYFDISAITNERGEADNPWYWSSTTHLDGPADRRYAQGVYVTFGRAAGWMQLPGRSYLSFLDVHGAGAQRSDPKRGNVTEYFLGHDSLGNPVYGRGPQGDLVRIQNFVRLVRDADQAIEEGNSNPGGRSDRMVVTPNPARASVFIRFEPAAAGRVTLAVHDMAGRRVTILVDAELAPGVHAVRWRPGSLSAGTYFCTMSSRLGVQAERFVLVD